MLNQFVTGEPTFSLSIYPFSTEIRQETIHVYTVPPNYVGSTLLCNVNGWPAPQVEWHKDGLPLSDDNGTVSEFIATSTSRVSARLTWTREFSSFDTGSYECVVHKLNTTLPVASQSVELRAGTVTSITVLSTCSVGELSMYFQIRVFGTDCQNWKESQKQLISAEIREQLLSVTRTECHCEVGDSELQMRGVPQCSAEVDEATVFRGLIETGSLKQTKQIFCALSSWLQRFPLLQVDGKFQAVDTSCSMEAVPTANRECAPPGGVITPKHDIDLKMTLMIAGTLTLVIVLVLLLVIVLCCIGCYCQRGKGKELRPNGNIPTIVNIEDEDHTYARLV